MRPELTRPGTPAARAADDIAERYYSTSLLNHCLRSYHWGILYAGRHGLVVDQELLYVSAMLHDLGLVQAFDNYTQSFELAGADLAWMFGAAAGWPEDRRTHAGDVIVAHMADELVSVNVDVEGHLLSIATSLDISGTGVHLWPDHERSAVLEALPRHTLSSEFLACFEDQAQRKPDSSPATALVSGIAQRISDNSLDRV
jgi:hypothetical protein